MKILKVLTLIIALSVLTIACGSSGGGGGGGDTTETVIALKTDVLRTESQGDTWTYSGSGTVTNGSNTVDISGTVNFQVLSGTKTSPITGFTSLDKYSVINLSTPTGPLVVSVHIYFYQDVDGTMYVDGQSSDSGDIWVTSPVQGFYLSMESPVSVGQNYSSSVTYDDGSSATYATSVTGIENVSTGMGTYEAYRLVTNATFYHTNGDRVDEVVTEWHVPGLGSIKAQIDASYYVGGVYSHSMDLTFTLSSTSVSY